MKRKILLFVLVSLMFAGCTLPSLRQKQAAIQINTNPQADVFFDNEKVGQTPFQSEKLKAKEYTVKLVPKEESLAEWQTTVTLQSGITTVISYDFGKTRETSAGETLTLEPLADSSAVEIAAVSMPDNASVKLDSQPKGFTPLQMKDIAAGTHTLIVSAPGYKQHQAEIKAVAGYRLTIDIQLAKEEVTTKEATPSAQPTEAPQTEKKLPKPTPTVSKSASPSAQVRPYVEILETPTGWLRVRSSPVVAEDNEIAKVNPGETYPYLDSNDTGWIKISLSQGKEGWISGRYTKVYR